MSQAFTMDAIEWKRTMLAAHAPPVPDWFNPAMPPKPEVPSSHGLDFEVRTVLYHWDAEPPPIGSSVAMQHCEPVVVTQELIDQATTWREVRAMKVVEREEWREQQKIQRIIQWPFAYADMVLTSCTAIVDSDLSHSAQGSVVPIPSGLHPQAEAPPDAPAPAATDGETHRPSITGHEAGLVQTSERETGTLPDALTYPSSPCDHPPCQARDRSPPLETTGKLVDVQA